ncbi:MAG: hypothetical protein ACJAQT_002146 [Akkermansiaceae bacterium]
MDAEIDAAGDGELGEGFLKGGEVVGEAGFTVPALHGEDVDEAPGAEEEEADGPEGGEDPGAGDGKLRGGLGDGEGGFWEEVEEGEDEEKGKDGDGEVGVSGGVAAREEPHCEGGEEGEEEGGEHGYLVIGLMGALGSEALPWGLWLRSQ